MCHSQFYHTFGSNVRQVNPKLSPGVNCGPATHKRPDWDVPCWDRLQQPRGPEKMGLENRWFQIPEKQSNFLHFDFSEI